MWLDSILHYAFFFEILFLLVQFFFFTQTFFVHEWGEDIIWTFWTNRAGHERAQREKEIDEELKHVENFLFFGSVLYIRMRRRRRKIIGVRVWRQFISWNYTHTQTEKTVDFLDLLVVESFSASLRALCISFSSFPLCFIISFFGLMFIFTSSQKKKKMKKKKEKRFPL